MMLPKMQRQPPGCLINAAIRSNRGSSGERAKRQKNRFKYTSGGLLGVLTRLAGLLSSRRGVPGAGRHPFFRRILMVSVLTAVATQAQLWLPGICATARADSEPAWSVNEFPVVVRPEDQNIPRLDGADVVFRDYSPQGLVRLMKKPLLGGDEEEIVSADIVAGPDSYSGAVAWQVSSGEVCRRTLAGGEGRCVSSTSAVYLALSGMYAITEAGNTSRISLIDFSEGRSRVLDSTTGPGMRYDPAIDGNRAVWIKERGYAGRYYEPLVVSYDIPSGTSTYLTRTGGGTLTGGGSRYERKNPVIDGERVFYQQKDGLSATEWDISEALSGTFGAGVVMAPGNQVNPSVSGNLVVYQDNRNGHYDESGKWVGEWDIYLKDLERDVEQPLCQAAGDQKNPVIRGNVVLWEDERNGNRDIYAAILSPGAGETELMRQYAPLLVMHSDEDFLPMNVEQMVAIPGTALIAGGVEQLRSPETLNLVALAGFAGGAHVDLPAPCIYCGPHAPSSTIEKYNHYQYVKPYQAAVAAGGYRPAVYGRVVEKGEGKVIQYWLNYLFNSHPLLSHEGDWEMIEVELDANSQPIRVSGSQHYYGRMRNWRDLESRDGHPLIYVARGSHANYFEAGEHIIEINGVPFPVAYDSTVAANQGRLITPEVIPMPATATGDWPDFGGQWGEPSDRPGGGAPVGPRWTGSRWSQPFAWEGLVWDGFGGMAGRIVGLEVRTGFSVKLDVFNSYGGHVGEGAAGGIEVSIDGARYIEQAELGQKAVLVPGRSIMAKYRIELSAATAQHTALELSLPDPINGAVMDVGFEDIVVGDGVKAWIDVTPGLASTAYRLNLDTNGDGSADSTFAPTGIRTPVADLVSPARITDITASRAADGSVRLSFTAPGDDDSRGTAAAYAVRYSTEPVDENNWHLAEPLEVGDVPKAGGSTETFNVGVLPAGKPLYFAVRAIDEAGNTGELSRLATDAQPDLVLSSVYARWGSYADYAAGILTVKYRVTNIGSGPARDLTVREIFVTAGSATLVPERGVYMETVEVGAAADFDLRFHVMPGCSRFTTLIYATCSDLVGVEKWLPEPPPMV